MVNLRSGLIALIITQFWAPLCVADTVQGVVTPDHHTKEGFRNYPVIEDNAHLGFAFYWKRFIASFSSPDVPDHHVLPKEEAIARYDALHDENSVTWIGQSTLIIKINGVVILTDPYFAKLASPVMVGPERFVEPGIAADELPKVDIILVSHNHYDHLDEAFIEKLPNITETQVVVPLGLGEFFAKRGYHKIHELDWHDSVSLAGMQFTSLPAVHYSGRGGGDKNKTLWCAWAISTPVGQYFFLADSAYSPTLFKEIGDVFSSFDFAMVPIGTYGNRKYGVNNHTTPEEAVQLANEIGAEVVMGIHWGTIDLSDEDPWEPPLRFRSAAEGGGYNPKDVWLLKIGESRRLPQKPEATAGDK